MPQPAKPDCQSISQHCPQTMSLREITNLSLTTVTDQYICHTHSQPPVTLTESGSACVQSGHFCRLRAVSK